MTRVNGSTPVVSGQPTNIPVAIPGNMSIRSALGCGLLSHNAVVATINGASVSQSHRNATVGFLVSNGLLDSSLPASALTFGQYGGD